MSSENLPSEGYTFVLLKMESNSDNAQQTTDERCKSNRPDSDSSRCNLL